MSTQLAHRSARTTGHPSGAATWRRRPLSRELVAAQIAELAGSHQVLTFLKRRMPMGRGIIDLITVSPGGVTVVGALLVRGSTLTIARSGGGFAEPRSNRLLADGRDQTFAADVVERQITAVRHALATDGGGVPPVRGALCTQGSIDLPAFASLRLHEIVIDGVHPIAELAGRGGDLTPEHVLRIGRRLERAFPRF